MTRREKIIFQLQHIMGYLAAPLLAPLYFLFLRVMGYRLRDLSKTRDACRRLFREHKGPWIICANHLTMIDSLLLIYAMASLPGHLIHYRRLPWNLPERDNFQLNPALSLMCYLAKCVPVNRGGDREEMKKVLEKCGYLLANGHSLMIFPEGGRSRTGRVDRENYTYGVGRFISAFPESRVLCLYLRGERQESYGNMPKWGERFYVAVEPLAVERGASAGLRENRALAGQVIETLARMEDDYFALCRQRHRGSAQPGSEGEGPRSALRGPGADRG